MKRLSIIFSLICSQDLKPQLYYSKSKIPITLAEAKEKGLGPCGVCKP